MPHISANVLARSLVLLVFVALAGHAAAQPHRASVRGRVIDASGAPLARAQIKAVKEGTNETRETTTDESGRFALPELAVGTYRLEATLGGYRTYANRTELAVGQDLWLDVPLELAVAQAVEVTAPFVPIDRDSAALGTLVDQRQVTGLPLDGRNFLELALLAPGTCRRRRGRPARSAATSRSASTAAARMPTTTCSTASTTSTRSSARRACGRRSTRFASSKSLTSTYDASFGRNAAGQVNVVTRSGANGSPGRPTSSSATGRSTPATTSRRRTSRSPTTTAISSAARSAGRSRGTARSSSSTTRARGCARGSRASPTCRPPRNAPATSRSRCSRRRVDPFTRPAVPGRTASRRSSSARSARRSPRCIRCRIGRLRSRTTFRRRRCEDDVDQFDVRVDHALGGGCG